MLFSAYDNALRPGPDRVLRPLPRIDKTVKREHNSASPLTGAPTQKTVEIVMKQHLVAIGLLGITLTAGCAAHSSKPIIDPEGVDMEQYQADIADCEEIATQVDQKAGEGAVGGAVVGGLIGAIVGDNSVGTSAGVGAVVGGAQGAATTEKEKSQVVKNCLRNRGYEILN